MKVLLLGADGFIGRHIAFHLRSEGVQVIAQARNPSKLARMGFATLHADFTNRATHAPAFWQPHLDANTHILNAAGLLTGTAKAFQAVHVKAPAAAYAARHPGTQALLISAVGIEADTPFSHWRREGEAAARAAEVTILRAGLVLADTSYGGSSLSRALAALPFLTPVIGTGEQPFNPIHASDLAAIALACLQSPTPGTWEIGGPQTVSQTGILRATQSWLGLPQRPLLHIPLRLARRLGQIGDVLSIGPISATSVAHWNKVCWPTQPRCCNTSAPWRKPDPLTPSRRNSLRSTRPHRWNNSTNPAPSPNSCKPVPLARKTCGKRGFTF